MTSWLMKSADRLLDLKADRELLFAIALLDEALDNDPMDSDLEDVFQALAELTDGGPNAQRVRDILTGKKLDADMIKQAWRTLRLRVTGSLPQKYRPLGMPLALLKQPGMQRALEWVILDEGQPQTAELPVADLLLQLSGEASFSADLEAYPIKLPKAFPPDLARPQIRIGAKGQIKLTAGAELPVFRVGLSARGEAQAGVALDWFFYNKESALFANALIHDLGRMRSPFDLSVLDEVFAPHGSDTPGLAALQVNLEAGLGFSGEIGLAEPLEFLAAGMPVQATAKIGFKARGGGAINYLVHRDESGLQPRLLVRMRRLETEAQSRAATLEVSLDLGQHYQDVRKLLLAKLPELSQLLDKLETAIPTDKTVQAKLVAEAQQALDSSPYKVLLNAALGFNDDKTASQLLADLILNKVENSASRWQGEATKAADKVIDQVIGHLKLGSPLADDLRARSTNAAREALESERKRLNDAIKDAVRGNAYQEVAQILDALGNKVDTSITNLASRVKAVTDPILTELNHYQAQLEKLTKTLEEATAAKLRARVESERGSSQETGLDLVLRFDPKHPQAADHFRQMLTGNLDKVFQTLRAQPAGGPVELVSGKLSRHIQVTGKSGYDLILFDIQFTGQRTAISDVEYTVDQGGNIQVRSKGQIEACRRGWKEGRCIRFVNAFELATAARTRSLALSLGLSQEDDDLDLDDVQGFFGSLEVGGLVPAGATVRAMAQLRKLDDRDPRTLLKGKLEAGFALGAESIDTFLGLDGQGNVWRTDGEILRIAVEELVTAGKQVGLLEYPLDRQRLERIRTDFPQLEPPQPTDIVSAILAMTPDLAIRLGNSVTDDDLFTRRHDIWAVGRYHEHAANIVRMVHTLRDVYLSGEQPGVWKKGNYLKVQSELDEALKTWLRVGKGQVLFFLLPDKIRPFTVAFLRILARLAGLPLAGGGVLNASFTVGEKRYELT